MSVLERIRVGIIEFILMLPARLFIIPSPKMHQVQQTHFLYNNTRSFYIYYSAAYSPFNLSWVTEKAVSKSLASSFR